MADVVVIGGGGHAKVLIAVLQRSGSTLRGYVDPVDRGPVLGVPRLGGDEALASLAGGSVQLALGVGAASLDSPRRALAASAEAAGFEFVTAVSPEARIHASVSLGAGSMVCDGAVVQPDVRVGRFAILNTSCSVDHDCEIADFAHLAPGVTVGGGARIGENALVGIGAVVGPGVAIGRDCCLGAGAVAVADCLEPGTYVGAPARRAP